MVRLHYKSIMCCEYRKVSSQTYSYIVDGHADRSMVINLLRGNGLGLVGQKDSQQQQKALVAVHHTWREKALLTV